MTSPQPSAVQQATATYHMVDLADLTAAGYCSAASLKLNDSRQIAGSSVSKYSSCHAFFWDGNGLQDVGTLGGTTIVTAMNQRGQVVGRSQGAGGQDHALLWQDGHMRDLGTLGGAASEATAINERGQIVGSSQTADGQTHAFLWENGQMRDLGTLAGGMTSVATAIDNAGNIAGYSHVPRVQAYRYHPVLWAGDTIVDLGALFYEDFAGNPPGIEQAEATDINNRGVVVGFRRVPPAPGLTTSWPNRAFVWQGGALNDLGALANSIASAARRVNSRGQIAGVSKLYDDSFFPTGVVWDRGEITSLGSLDPAHANSTESGTDVSEMNEGPVIVGDSWAPNHVYGSRHAFVWENGRMQDLGSLGGNSRAVSVNHSGDVAGWSISGTGALHLGLWRRMETSLASASQ